MEQTKRLIHVMFPNGNTGFSFGPFSELSHGVEIIWRIHTSRLLYHQKEEKTLILTFLLSPSSPLWTHQHQHHFRSLDLIRNCKSFAATHSFLALRKSFNLDTQFTHATVHESEQYVPEYSEVWEFWQNCSWIRLILYSPTEKFESKVYGTLRGWKYQ